MPNQPFIDIVTKGLAGGLIHPGDDKTKAFPLPLPTFRTAGMPKEMAQHFAEEAGLPHPDIAKLTAEALDNLLEQQGKSVVDTAELTRLRKLDADWEPRRKRTVALTCNCGAMLARVNVTDLDTDKPKVFGAKFIAAMQQLSVECASGHRPQGAQG
ncbi:hypothetical protein DSM43518_02038 [Mycobacterium marinum]|uniref:hypothetical protein n=1 Tax=Mycobacterium marinum TaxID=1781 RepID=UPI000CD9D50B|nr:hypothetical protein [Mycobacterium marinum]AXN50956.1 hypothetical protein CCUG20998_03554 [Mycobacterium marinum]RFZ11198.1 hypothetical protein DSM43518_02038 [Mycobacterium marinum]RFZ15030.1 hypothetical protein VIMS_02460 [Mycobacterium marinum]RFZ25446.1 hypothetical protein DSM43519_01632 [Mycobacterium marinum]RFZ28333.1 hypothetical protein DSM44344_01378 [Mycobacterium marinum]